MSKLWMKFICLIVVLALAGCRSKDDKTQTEDYIFRPGINMSDLKKVEYNGDLSYGEKSVKDMLKALEHTDEEAASQTAFVKGVKVVSFEIEEEYLMLHFNQEYTQLDVIEEVLLRSSLVQSLTRIKGIEAVAFFLEEKPMTDKNEIQYGFMRAGDFVQNTGSAINSFENQTLTLYFTDDSGKALVKESRNVRYNSNSSMEKVIIEQILRGPNESGHQPTVPKETKLLGVTVKEGICYVNFDKGIEETTYNIVPGITIYSIVNSLVDNGIASRVQFSINGETSVQFRGNVDLSQPFSADTELLE